MAPDSPSTLESLRQQIDALDTQLLALLSQRGRLAVEIGRLKAAAGLPVYAPDRESEILAHLSATNPGPFPDSVLLAIYRELMSGSFLLERPLRIAYLGPRGSFTHLAASGKFGASVEYEPVADIAGIFAEVEREHVDYGVVPLENSTGGGITDTLDALAEARVRICGESLRKIHHNLLSRVPLGQIERVYSKPEIFDQCRQWLVETGLFHKTVPVASSSRAAEMAAAEANTAAIGSTLAGELYGLPVQQARIEDNPENITRFLILGCSTTTSMAAAPTSAESRPSADPGASTELRPPTTPRPTGSDKTALMFATPHRAGALVDILDIFRRESVNLTMITSRPSRRKNWEYYFFVDAEGHADDPPLARALAAARQQCPVFTALGSFPRATEAW